MINTICFSQNNCTLQNFFAMTTFQQFTFVKHCIPFLHCWTDFSICLQRINPVPLHTFKIINFPVKFYVTELSYLLCCFKFLVLDSLTFHSKSEWSHDDWLSQSRSEWRTVVWDEARLRSATPITDKWLLSLLLSFISRIFLLLPSDKTVCNKALRVLHPALHWDLNLDLLLVTYVILDRFFGLPNPQIPHMLMKTINA